MNHKFGLDDFFLLVAFAFTWFAIFSMFGCASCPSDAYQTHTYECFPPNQFLEEPPCWARQAEERIVLTFEENYGPVTHTERACIADYYFAVLDRDEWSSLGLREDAIGMTIYSGVIYLRQCRPERSPEGCAAVHADIHRHEVLHLIHHCLYLPGSNDHSSVAWQLLFSNYLVDPPFIECTDNEESSYCDNRGRECW